VGILFERSDELQRSTASFARLVGVTQLPFDHEEHPSGGPEPIAPAVVSRATGDAGTLGVEVRDLVFGYEPGRRVLDGVTLDVAPGEHLAVVGPSGAGKTTLGKLVAGLLHPQGGGAWTGGIAVDRLAPHDRARLVAMVAQEVHVFTNTVAENVRLGRVEATDDEVRAALAAVDALAWAEGLPKGLATRVGAGYQHVSTTRAQQLALARLVCLDPSVVVLDEATAELDPVAAARTERHLDAALGHRTVISIVHRLDVAERADRVLVLDRGGVVACGPHAELVREPGSAYAELWRAWSTSRREEG
jgi:ABC-type multidrug transport system fused ATPase/permease subunit